MVTGKSDPNNLETMEGFIREILNKPGAQVAASDVRTVIEGMINRPLMTGQKFPGILLLQMLTSRIMGDESAMDAMKQSKEGASLAALLPLISQLTTAVAEHFDTAASESAA